MKTVNYTVLIGKWWKLSATYEQRSISSADFTEECKRLEISLSNGMKQAYEEAKVITCPCRGQVVIASCITKEMVIKACMIVKEKRKKYREDLNKLQEYNQSVEANHNPAFTEEACVAFLRSRRWFCHKPAKGEKIFIGKEYTFD